MVSEAPSSSDEEGDATTEKPVSRSSSSKNNPRKVPKKIHKAEREKLKRDHLNVLFLELSNSLDSVHQNHGKASTLTEATRLLRDLVAQVDSLKRENTSLLSESHYLKTEKNELKEENAALEDQIQKLQSGIGENIRSESVWKLDHAQSHGNTSSQLMEENLVVPLNDGAPHPTPVLGPLFVIPMHHDRQTYSQPETAQAAAKLPSKISRPHARYPSPSDSWPSQILAYQSNSTEIAEPRNISGTSR